MSRQVHTCENGVRIVMEPMSFVRSVSIGIWVNNGSRHEKANENGLSHFIEHMLFKGTASNSAKDIAKSFDRIGGNVNAYTSKEETCYYAKVLDHHSEQALSLIADMFFHSVMDPEEIEKERSVILEEIAMVEDTPDDDVHELLFEVMYPKHSLGKPILGTNETVQSFRQEDIVSYMKRTYTPKNTVISIAGNVNDELVKKAIELFSNWSVNAEQVETTKETPSFQSGFSNKLKETEQSHLCLGYPSVSVHDEDLYTMSLVNNMIGGNMSSRLFQEVREDLGLAYSIYSYMSSYKDTGAFVIYGGTTHAQLPELEETILKSIQKVIDHGFTPEEIEDAKQQVIGSLYMSEESTTARMNRNGKQLLTYNQLESIEDTIEKIQQIQYAQIQKCIHQVFSIEPAKAIIENKVK